MTNFYIHPFDIYDDKAGDVARVPMDLLGGLPHWGFDGKERISDTKWSAKDFDVKSHCLLATDKPLPSIDPGLTWAFPVNLNQAVDLAGKDNLGGFLMDIGLEKSWVVALEVASYREMLHRLLGLAFAEQERKDEPQKWLKRDIYFGEVGILSAFDTSGKAKERALLQEQALERHKKIYPYPITWEGGAPNFVMPDGRRIPVIQGGALPWTDSFTTGSDQSLTSYNSNYVMNQGAMAVVNASDDCEPNSGGAYSMAHDEANTYANDQYSQFLINAVVFGTFFGPAVRCASSSTYTGYAYAGDSGLYSQLSKVVSGTQTQLGSNGAAFVATHTYKLKAESTTITPMKDGSTADIGAQTDSSIASGYAGMAGYGNGGTRGDNMESDSIGGGGGGISIPVVVHHMKQQGMS
jgi:hypothetical protein